MNIEKKLEKIEKRLDDISNLYNPDLERLYTGVGHPSLGSSEIDFRELLGVLWEGKWTILFITFLFIAATVWYAISLPNIYRSEVLLAPAEENSRGRLSTVEGGLGGIASLAGINLNGGTDSTIIAIEVLKSRAFITKFVQNHDLLVPLMATTSWDRSSDQLVIDKKIYDETESKWVRDPKPPRAAKPSLQEAYSAFIKIFNVSKDKDTGLVSLSIDYYSPGIAKEWVDQLVKDINAEVKSRDMLEAKKNIQYLTGQLEKTAISEMRSVFYELIEEQTKTLMFAEVRDEYVFKTIDGAVVPEIKAKPNKPLICFLGAIFGVTFGMLLVFFRQFMKCF